MIGPKLLTSKKYPAKLRNHSLIRKNPKPPARTFKLFGLPNFQEKLSTSTILESHFFSRKSSVAENVVLSFKTLVEYLSKYRSFVMDPFSLTDLSGLASDLMDLCKIRRPLVDITKLPYQLEIKIQPDPLYSNLNSHFTQDVKIFKKGTSIINLVIYLRDYLEGIGLFHERSPSTEWRWFYDAITYHHLLSKKNLQVCFSADGPKGAWDLATMSMRGIKSCQAWTKPQAPALVGSVLDPCAGIIYLTDGTHTKYGTKMLGRSIVRTVIKNTKDNGAVNLLLERAYSSDPIQGGFYPGVALLEIFQNVLKKKTKLPIMIDLKKGTHIPIVGNATNSLLEEYDGKFLSYRDSHIDYGDFVFDDGQRPCKSIHELKRACS